MAASRSRGARYAAYLMALIIGFELLVLGATGLAASVPKPTPVTLVYDQANETRIVGFTPAPDWGSRVILLSLPNVHCASGVWGPGCPAAVFRVTACSDPTCSARGPMNDSLGLINSDGIATGSTQATFFEITLVSSPWNSTVLRVVASWSDPQAWLPLGGTNWETLFSWLLIAGMIVLPPAVILWSRETDRPVQALF